MLSQHAVSHQHALLVESAFCDHPLALDDHVRRNAFKDHRYGVLSVGDCEGEELSTVLMLLAAHLDEAAHAKTLFEGRGALLGNIRRRLEERNRALEANDSERAGAGKKNSGGTDEPKPL